MSKRDAVRTQLQERLTQLTQRAGKIAGDLRQTLNRDWEEQAAELEDDQVLEGLDAMTLAEVKQIREALRRIDTGSYGVCSTCGRPISAERLVAVPSAVNCVGCAS